MKRYLQLIFSRASASASVNRSVERYRRVGMTAFSSFFSKALTVLISFASVPLTVHYLGEERYGVWLVISSLLTWIALTDFGLAGNALVNVIADATGKDDRQLAREYASSAFWALNSIALLLGALFFSVFHLISWRAVFRVSSGISTAELEQACALTLFMFVLGLPLTMVPSIYNAHQDGYLSNLWSISSNVLALVSLVLVTRIKGGLPLLIFAISGTRTIVIFASGCYAMLRLYPWLRPSLSAVRWERVRRLLSLGGKYMVTQLASLGIYQSQPLIITQILGPSQVTIFVIAYKIIALPVDLAYMATAPFLSAFSEARSRGDWNWIKEAYRKSTKASILFGLPLLLVMALAAKPLIRIWAGPNAVPDTSLVIWLSIYTLISVVMMSAGQMLSGLEKLGPLMLSIGLCSIGVIIFTLLFGQWWGLSGVALGMAVSKISTFLPIQVLNVRRILRQSEFQQPSEQVVDQSVELEPVESANQA